MDNRILVACDLHNTLLRSGIAWERAFTELSGGNRETIAKRLAEKCSRHRLADSLGVSYEDVYRRYCGLVEANRGVVTVVSLLQEKYPVVLVSGADRARVERDLQVLDDAISFDRIYTKETFRKDLLLDWEMLRKTYRADTILYFGNDPVEDVPEADFVQTLLVRTDKAGES